MKLKVLVQPNSKKNEVVGIHGDAVKIKIKAPPVDGEANEILVMFLSKTLNIPRKNFQILHGRASKNKLVEIATDLSTADIQKILISS